MRFVRRARNHRRSFGRGRRVFRGRKRRGFKRRGRRSNTRVRVGFRM